MKKFFAKYIWILAISLGIAVNATAETIDSSWCTIKTPDQAVAEGQSFEIEFMLKENAPAGLKTGGDLHFSDEKGAYLGFAAWGGEPRALKPGEKALFRYRLPKLKSGASCVYAQFFLAPTNWDDRVKEQRSADIPIFLASAKQPADAGAVRTKESDWCIIETPFRAEANGSFQTRVTLKKTAPAGLKIGGDIHLKNADTGAYLGYGSWGGPAKSVTPGESVTFTYQMPQLKSGANAVFIHYYLSQFQKDWLFPVNNSFSHVPSPS